MLNKAPAISLPGDLNLDILDLTSTAKLEPEALKKLPGELTGDMCDWCGGRIHLECPQGCRPGFPAKHEPATNCQSESKLVADLEAKLAQVRTANANLNAQLDIHDESARKAMDEIADLRARLAAYKVAEGELPRWPPPLTNALPETLIERIHTLENYAVKLHTIAAARTAERDEARARVAQAYRDGCDGWDGDVKLDGLDTETLFGYALNAPEGMPGKLKRRESERDAAIAEWDRLRICLNKSCEADLNDPEHGGCGAIHDAIAAARQEGAEKERERIVSLMIAWDGNEAIKNTRGNFNEATLRDVIREALVPTENKEGR